MFDKVLDDDMFGEESWEKAESKLVRENFENAIKKSGMTADNIDMYCGRLTESGKRYYVWS